MDPQYNLKNGEAMFGTPLTHEVEGGMHITAEILIKLGDNYFALRRPEGIPGHLKTKKEQDSEKGMLYFCHDFLRYGEAMDTFVRRVVQAQAGVDIDKFRVVELESIIKDEKWGLHKKQWALIPYIIAEISQKPKISPEVTEVVEFSKKNPPTDLAWWTTQEFIEFMSRYDS